MLEFFALLWDIVYPRFITEEVAMYRDDDGVWRILCAKVDLMPEDEGEYECIGVSRAFNFFGLGLFAKVQLPEGY